MVSILARQRGRGSRLIDEIAARMDMNRVSACAFERDLDNRARPCVKVGETTNASDSAMALGANGM
jgi:hypothetical protein